MYVVPKANNKYCDRLISVQLPKILNDLAETMLNLQSLAQVKANLRSWLKSRDTSIGIANAVDRKAEGPPVQEKPVDLSKKSTETTPVVLQVPIYPMPPRLKNPPPTPKVTNSPVGK
ncbi:hypothetical protein Trydic_g12024 [Trypoxylus dichotomus]